MTEAGWNKQRCPICHELIAVRETDDHLLVMHKRMNRLGTHMIRCEGSLKPPIEQGKKP